MNEVKLEVYKRTAKPPTMTKELKEKMEAKDIIVTKYKTVETINPDKSITTRLEPCNVNITKLVNEQKKTIKKENAEEILDELERIYTERTKK